MGSNKAPKILGCLDNFFSILWYFFIQLVGHSGVVDQNIYFIYKYFVEMAKLLQRVEVNLRSFYVFNSSYCKREGEVGQMTNFTSERP